MKNSARNALDQGIEHYRQVFEARGERERTVGTIQQDVPLLGQIYFTRSEDVYKRQFSDSLILGINSPVDLSFTAASL